MILLAVTYDTPSFLAKLFAVTIGCSKRMSCARSWLLAPRPSAASCC
jgi:hypothetical protein